MTGSSTLAPLVQEIARRYEAANPEVRVDLQTGGTSRGLRDLRKGLVEVALVSRSLRAGEDDLHPTLLARDGIGVIVHRENPVPGLGREALGAIYRGEIEDWSSLGGEPGPITVVHKADGRSTQEVFLAFLGVRPSEVEADVVIGDNQQGIKTVAGNPRALGYVSIGTARAEIERQAPIRLLPIDSLVPSLENVSRGSYPMARPLSLVTRGAPSGEVARFLAFATDPRHHDLIAREYLVPPSS